MKQVKNNEKLENLNLRKLNPRRLHPCRELKLNLSPNPVIFTGNSFDQISGLNSARMDNSQRRGPRANFEIRNNSLSNRSSLPLL